MKILIAPNSFKECADSVTIASLFKKYLHIYFNQVNPGNDIIYIEKPISDGGDGFLSVCKNIFNLEIRTKEITYPYSDEKFLCEYGVSDDAVYIESAKVLGLNLIPPDKRHPLYLSSKGLGELLLQIMEEINEKDDVRKKVVIGIGGTGTSDFGIGLCSLFGLKLLDKTNNELMPLPIHFRDAVRIIPLRTSLAIDVQVVIDVTTPLLGVQGASRVFAPQKGAAPDDVEALEEGTTNIVSIFQKQDPDFQLNAIYGAGGGLAGCLYYFFNAKYILARDFIRKELGISKQKVDPDIIITGEGTMDVQSSYDKGSMLVINEFENTCKPIFICNGILKDEFKIKRKLNLYFIELSRYFNTKEESIKNIEKGIQLASKEIVEICKAHHYIS